MTTDEPVPRLWSSKAFLLLWIATVASNLGTQVQSVASAWLMTDIGSSAQVALIQSLISLPLMIFALPTGVLADVFDRWRLIAFAYFLMAVAALAAAVAGFGQGIAPALLLLLCFLFGSGQAFFGPTSMAAVRDSVHASMIAAGVAALSVAFNLARCLGPTLGGGLVAVGGAKWTFAVNAALCGSVLLLLLAAPHKPVAKGGPRPALLALLTEGLRYGAMDHTMRVIALRMFAFTASASPIWALLPLLARGQLHGTALTYGITMSALGIGALVISFCLRPLLDRYRGETIFRWSTSITAIALLTLPLASHWLIATVQLFAAGAAWVASLTIFNIAAQSNAPAPMVGRAIGIFYSSIFGGLTVGSALFGHIVETSSLTSAFLLSGTLVILTLIAGSRWSVPIPSAIPISLEPSEAPCT
jgi:MFS family permease